MTDAKVDKGKFDALLRKMIETPPTTFRDVVEHPKRTQGGDIKRTKRSRKSKKSAA